MTRDRLEGLSFQSLYRLAAEHGVDLFPDQSKDEVIDSILEAIEESRVERESSNNNLVNVLEKKYDLSVIQQFDDGATEEIELPEAYNVTRIVLMLRDPSWAFTYWDIRERDFTALRNVKGFQGLALRVRQYRGDEVVDSFDIPVGLSDSRWYIHLPEKQASYRVQLLARYDSEPEARVVSDSNPVYVPPATILDESSEDGRANALLVASGLDGIDVASFDGDIPQRIISSVGD